MNSLLVGIAIGAGAYYVFDHILLRIARSRLGSPESAIRKNLLDKMGFDALISFHSAVEEEIRRRTRSGS